MNAIIQPSSIPQPLPWLNLITPPFLKKTPHPTTAPIIIVTAPISPILPAVSVLTETVGPVVGLLLFSPNVFTNTS